MELATLLETIAGGDIGEVPDPTAENETVPITGYEIDDSDWQALEACRDGRASSLPDTTITWLTTVGLLERDASDVPALTPFAIEWLGWHS